MAHRVIGNQYSRRRFLSGLAAASGGLALPLLNGLPIKAQPGRQDELDQQVYFVVGALLDIEFWEDPIAGLEAVQDMLGVQVKLIGPDAWDSDAQIAEIYDALNVNPKGFAILPVDHEAMTSVINDILGRGIPVVTVDTDAPHSQRLCYLGTDRYQAGSQAADAMVRALGGSGEVAVLTLGGSEALEQSLWGFLDRLADIAPGVTVGHILDSQANDTVIREHVTTLLEENAGLSGIFANDTQSAVSVPAQVLELGKGGTLALVANGATLRTRDAMEAVASGVLTASITQRSFQAFYYAVQFLYDLANNRSANMGMSWVETGISPLPTRVDTGTMIITQENAEGFLSLLREATSEDGDQSDLR